MGTNATTFPEWERARQRSRPEDDAQKRLVGLLEQPIAASETQKLAVRTKALRDLADGMPEKSASRMRDRLSNPKDPLGQFTTFELSPQLRDDLIRRLSAREKAGSRGTDQKQRGTEPAARGVSTGFPFMFGPPVVIPFPGISSPQYFPNGLPPLGIFGRPVMLVPELQPGPGTAEQKHDQKKPPPPPPPKKPDKKEHKDVLPGKPPRKKPPVLPPARTGPGVLDWLQDRLTHATHSAALMIGGLLLALPAEAVAAAIAAAASAFAEGATTARAGEKAAAEMLKWTLKKAGLPQDLFDLNDVMKRFPGIDLISKVRPWQVKMWGVNSKRSKWEVAMDIANAMVDLFDDHPANRLPATTWKELMKEGVHTRIKELNAWPASWPDRPTLDQMRVLLRDTAFAVPDDLVVETQNAFAKRVLESPKFRELFPDLRIGSLAEVSALSRADQVAWGKRMTNFLVTHVIRVGVTTDQLRTMAAVGKEIVAP